MSESDSQRLARRVDELESTITFQDRKLEALDGVIRELFARVDGLQSEHERLRARVQELESGGEG